MDRCARTERKARELMRSRKYRGCDTCKHSLKNGCAVTPDKNICVYKDFELWKPRSEAFFKLADDYLNGNG